jgi:D-glycero-D-manno-heptose 1,7-bisphosphate phosphatase
MNRRRFVLLDRDGTIIVDKHYLADPAEIELLPGSVMALRRLSVLGLGLVVVTNQSGVARGYFDAATVSRVHQELSRQLERLGVHLDGIYYCPHLPEDECDCRKPRSGLVERAVAAMGFDPRRSFVVGDKPGDIALGRAIGATTLLVRTGRGAATEAEGEQHPDHVVDDLREAAEIIERLLD